MTRGDLAALLGTTNANAAGLQVVHTLDTALATMSDAAAATDADSPTCLLLVQPLHGPDRYRVEQAITGRAAVTAVMLASWPAHPTWHIGIDGAVVVANGWASRLCVLNARAAADLLSLLPPPAPRNAAHRRLPPMHTPADQPEPRPPAGDAVPVLDRPISLTVLGPGRLRAHNEPVTLRRSAALQVLVYLAVHRDGATARDITEAIWPGVPPATITDRLYTTISSINTALPTARGRPVDHADGRYRLNPDLVTVDLWQLQTAIRAATTALPGRDRQTALHAIVNHNHGELAAGCRWPWLPPHREAIRRDIIDAYTELADNAPADEALNLLRRALTLEPHNQALNRRAISAVQDAGDTAAAATAEPIIPEQGRHILDR
jgi:DNA-binding SARP family transcriptional activator